MSLEIVQRPEWKIDKRLKSTGNGTSKRKGAFKGQAAVILQRPATVQLDAVHFVEKIPADPKLYWNHLTAPGLQFGLPLDW